MPFFIVWFVLLLKKPLNICFWRILIIQRGVSGGTKQTTSPAKAWKKYAKILVSILGFLFELCVARTLWNMCAITFNCLISGENKIARKYQRVAMLLWAVCVGFLKVSLSWAFVDREQGCPSESCWERNKQLWWQRLLIKPRSPCSCPTANKNVRYNLACVYT